VISRFRRLFNLLRGRDFNHEIDEELQFHIDARIHDNIAAGMDEQEARRDALARFGSAVSTRDAVRDTHVLVTVESILQDIRFAIRGLARRPIFTAVAITTLALGIGASTAVFTVVRSVLLRPLSFPEPDRLFVIFNRSGGGPSWMLPALADADYLALRNSNRAFEAMATFASSPATLTGAGEAVRVPSTLATSDFFRVLRVDPGLGRTFVPDDERAGNNQVAVVSDSLWRGRFGGDPSLVGRTIALNGIVHRVVGIMPRGFEYPRKTQVWTPLEVRSSPNLSYARPVIARLRVDVSPEAAASVLHSLQRPKDSRERWQVLPLKTALVGDTTRPLLVFSAAVAFVLLIACANVANLLIMRGVSRRHEIATRIAIGAGRGRLVRQLLTESVTLSIAGGLLGVALAYAGVPALMTMMPPGRIPTDIDIRIDTVVLACALVVSVLTGALLGVAPALQAAREDLAGPMREWILPTRHSNRVKNLLVVGEVALALMLVVGAGLLIRTFVNLRSVNTGFDPGSVVTMTVDLPGNRYKDAASLNLFHDRLLSALAAIPKATAVGLVNWLPLGDMLIRGDFVTQDGAASVATKAAISPGYFDVMRIQMIDGRSFDDSDVPGAPGAAIVSRSIAERLWPGARAIGKRISLQDDPRPEDWLTVVGVVDDVRQQGVRESAVPAIYQPFRQVKKPFFLDHMTFAVRTGEDPQRVAPLLRSALAAVDSDQAPQAIATMEEILVGTIAEPRFQSRLLGVFSFIAVLLAAIGIYGVLASAVAERRREIGIRLALGAARSSVIRMVLKRSLVLSSAGICLGLLGSLATTRVLSSLLFNVTPLDAFTFAAASVAVTAVALLAALLPARHASRVDPLTALRTL
jgi:putative ABC transport system permease protein